MAQAGTTYEVLRSEIEIPHLLLPEGYRLRCLYGKHRVKAAEEALFSAEDHWWPVALYHESKSSKLGSPSQLIRSEAFRSICNVNFASIEIIHSVLEIYSAIYGTAR
ncbi:hypothetical protein BDW72DRAFT_91324 [Aspergillus terricola var. indicus]